MKNDEFAFFNQQLSAMLRDGIPLEGALRQLRANMRRGRLRSELELLEKDLSGGAPIQTALAARKLPEFYVQMVQVGVQSNDLPGVLLMLADYYQRVDSIWTRLKGLMVYPLLVLTGAFALSCFLTFLGSTIFNSSFSDMNPLLGHGALSAPAGLFAGLWGPPVLIGALLVAFLLFLFTPRWHRKLRWRLPAFKEAKLAQVASAMRLMLKTGGNLGDSLRLIERLEKGSPAGEELVRWRARLSAGHAKFSDMATPGKAFPPLFVWLVGNSGEDLAGGFQRAAEIYGARAGYRIEMFLYAALPFSVLALGAMILCQLMPLVKLFTTLMSALDGISK
jgi:type II secretory pathway component PulF